MVRVSLLRPKPARFKARRDQDGVWESASAAWMNSARRGYEATAARAARRSARMSIWAAMIGNPHRSARISAGATCRQTPTASHRTGSTRSRPERLRPCRWARMNRSSAGAGKKLASPRWRQPLPTRWARRSAANAVITLPSVRAEPPPQTLRNHHRTGTARPAPRSVR